MKRVVTNDDALILNVFQETIDIVGLDYTHTSSYLARSIQGLTCPELGTLLDRQRGLNIQPDVSLWGALIDVCHSA